MNRGSSTVFALQSTSGYWVWAPENWMSTFSKFSDPFIVPCTTHHAPRTTTHHHAPHATTTTHHHAPPPTHHHPRTTFHAPPRTTTHAPPPTYHLPRTTTHHRHYAPARTTHHTPPPSTHLHLPRTTTHHATPPGSIFSRLPTSVCGGLVFLPQRVAVAIVAHDKGGCTGSARRRCERRLRSMLRHGRMAVAMALTEFTPGRGRWCCAPSSLQRVSGQDSSRSLCRRGVTAPCGTHAWVTTWVFASAYGIRSVQLAGVYGWDFASQRGDQACLGDNMSLNIKRLGKHLSSFWWCPGVPDARSQCGCFSKFLGPCHQGSGGWRPCTSPQHWLSVGRFSSSIGVTALVVICTTSAQSRECGEEKGPVHRYRIDDDDPL